MSLLSLVNYFGDIEGDIVELGVFKGKTIQLLKSFLILKNKVYHGFDTFGGYTEEDFKSHPEKNNVEGLKCNQESKRWKIDPEIVHSLIKEESLNKHCNIYVGDLKLTFKNAIENKLINKISVLLVDCNAYLPSYTGMNIAYDIVSTGGAIVIDEHTVGGETAALKDFASEHNLQIQNTGFSYPHGPSKYIIK